MENSVETAVTASGPSNDLLLNLTADIVSAYVSNNVVPVSDLPKLIQDTFSSLGNQGSVSVAEQPVEKAKPAVPVKSSIDRNGEFIICLEDGQKFKSLKRHLMTHYNITPEEYRAKWGLPVDYPMVAPKYAEARSRLAKEMGLGNKRAGQKKAA